MSVWFLLNNLHDVPLHKVMGHKRKAMENRFRAFINYLFSVLGLTLCLLICRKIHNSNFSSFSNLSFPKPNHWKFIHNVGYHKIQDKFDFWLYNRLGTDHLTCRGGGVMVFCFVQKFFFGQHKSYNIYFFCRAKHNFFSRIYH